MRSIYRSSQFKSDLKRVSRSGRYKLDDLLEVVSYLTNNKPLPTRCRDHTLVGDWHNHRECHIKPDWLLIYRLEENKLILERTGSHADLF